jgi:hypothetical protein
MLALIVMHRLSFPGTRLTGSALALTRNVLLPIGIALAAVLTFGAAPAGAVITQIESQAYGIAPAEPSGVHAGIANLSAPLSYEGGPVVHSSATYLLFWAPQISPTSEYPQGNYAGNWQGIISEFFQGEAGESGQISNVFGVVAQYREGATGPNVAYSSSFRGAYTDTDSFPKANNCGRGSICLTTAEIRRELLQYIEVNSLPTGLNPATGSTPIYFVFTPPGVDVCAGEAGATANCSEPESATELSQGQICSYHSFIPAENGHQTILYAVEPWSAGNYGTVFASPKISGTNCQDDSGTLQEPNQDGLGADGEYNQGLADLIVNQAADEQIATLTDPLFTGWHDTDAVAGDTDEVPDKCRNDFLGGLLTEETLSAALPHTEAGTSYNQEIGGNEYYLNDEFDQAAIFDYYPGVACINRVNMVPKFTTQANVDNQQILTFNASESDVDLGVAKYQWEFGDGSGAEVQCENHTPTNGYSPEECHGSSGVGNPNPVASVVHTYTYGGIYDVTLTITDDSGNVATVTHQVTVGGPPAPVPAPPLSGGGGAAGSGTGSAAPGGSGSTGSPTTTPPGPTYPAPVLTASVPSKELKKATSKGLAVSYTVNEQVAGSLQVLLESSAAKRLGISGPVATNLPASSPRSIVIGTAVLVTTKAGKGTIHIKFSTRTAKRLGRMHKVKLTLRLIARNASRQSPLSTTLLSTIVLN